MSRHHNTAQGILLMCGGIAFLCINDAIAKVLAETYPPLQVLFLRNIIALPFAALIALKSGGVAALVSFRPLAHIVRGALWVAATTSFFTSLIYLGLAEATALLFIAPLFIVALTAILLREHVSLTGWLAVFAGFAGVLIVIRPGGEAFQAASLLPLASALAYAALMLSARWVDPRESVWTMMLYLTGAGSLVSGLIVPFIWTDVQARDLWLFLAIALFGSTGVTMMSQAFRFAPPAVIAPLEYSGLIWATALGWLIWSEVPDIFTYAGAAIVMASGTVIIWRERRGRR